MEGPVGVKGDGERLAVLLEDASAWWDLAAAPGVHRNEAMAFLKWGDGARRRARRIIRAYHPKARLEGQFVVIPFPGGPRGREAYLSIDCFARMYIPID